MGNLAAKPFQQEPFQKAVAMALIEFLKLVQQQLKIRCKLNDEEIKAYTQDIKKFIRDKTVKENLGKAFDINCEDLDAEIFKQSWRNLHLKPLPPKFNWQSVIEQYLLKVQENISDLEELRHILKLQKLTSIAENTKEIAGLSKDFDLRKYQEAIRERYVNLKLDSLDTDASAYNRLGLWDIFIPQNTRQIDRVLPELPREYLKRLQESNQLDAGINLERIEEELEKYKSNYIEQASRSVLEITQDESQYSSKKYIVILGDPGSGKSTLLQYLALNWVENTLDQEPLSQPIPLLIELRTYARDRTAGNCQDFLEFFHKSPNCICHLNQHKLEEQLKAGNALVMFDGLDEVFNSAQREEVITAIHRFTNDYPRVQVILTSRVVGYKPQRLRDAEFTHFMLQDLDVEQIKIFIHKWHDKTFSSGDEADKIRKKERLQKAINDSPAIQDLAGNPLLLTMMAILNRNQELPRDRAELYNQASRLLLHQWDVERTLIQDKRLDPVSIDYKDKQAMLRQVAYFMQTEDKGLAGNLIQERDLQKILQDYLKTIEFSKSRDAAKLIINQLRTRNFMLCYLGADYYAFVHRTFLEYFCAWEFVWQFKETQTLTIEQLIAEVVDKHWMDESWHEVLRLIAGMIDAKFVEKIIQHLISIDGEEEKFVNLFLAADCLAEVRNRKVILSTDKQLLVELKELVNYGICRTSIFLEDNGRITNIRTRTVKAVANAWKDDRDALNILKQYATTDKDEHVRNAAVHELAVNFKDDPDTLNWLKQATNDNNSDVRSAAVHELAYGFKDNPDTLTILKQATTDDDWYVRRIAVQELARNFKDDPDTLNILQQATTDDDEYEYVRCTALQELARVFKDNPDALTILKQATIDDDYNLRITALGELASGFKNDPDTLTILKQATTDDDCLVRRIAVGELADGFKDNPETLNILKQATTDDDSDVRSTAERWLERLQRRNQK